MKKLLALVVSCLVAGSAYANTISVDLNPTILPDGGGLYNWTYDVSLNNGVLDDGSFVTIYDFRGFAGDVFSPAGWTLTTPGGGSTPPGYGPPAVNDSPTIPNLVWTYTGDPQTDGDGNGGATLSWIFTVKSTIGSSMLGDYATRDYLADGSSLSSGSSGDTRVPLPDGGLTLALLGCALMGVETLRRRISKS